MNAPDRPRTWRPAVMGRRAAVCSNHPLATRAGIDVLATGGNAFDAAVAVAAAIAVVEPAMNGVGGDGFYLIYEATTGRATTVHAAGRTAARATLETFGDHIPSFGTIAAMPPGAVAGWDHLARRYGTRPLSELFAAAVEYARDGFAATRTFVRDVEMMRSALAEDAAAARVYLPGGTTPKVGTRIRNPALARTLEAVAAEGASVLFDGEVGRALCEFVRGTNGLFELSDLRGVGATEVPPLRTTYRGLTILEADRPTMGFALNLELNVLERFDVAGMAFGGADRVHLQVEAKKLAFVERERVAGDPDCVSASMADLLGEATAARLAGRIDMGRAASLSGGVDREGDTTYFCVTDETGNAVSGIQSLAGPFGSAAMDPETGVLLNNRMTWFHLDPEHPNVLGPRKLVRNTINPPMAIDPEGVRCVWGTPGGDAQVQISMQTLSAWRDHALDPQQAVESPRWCHFQPGTGSYFPHVDSDMLLMENRFEPTVLDELRKRGHRVAEAGPLDGPCAASMIARGDDRTWICGSDPRRDGWAAAL